MSEQKPSVGRMVHFYGADLRWHINMALRTPAQVKEDPAGIRYMFGPFAATIVFVRVDGRVNLRVDYPTPLWGSADTSEIVVDVPYVDQLTSDQIKTCEDRHWVWPPRVP